MVADQANNMKLAKAGLVNTMGLGWQTQIDLAARELPYSPLQADLAKLISSSYEFNPDWAKLAKCQLKCRRAKHSSKALPAVLIIGQSL
jgi:hypothetical protein